MIKKFFNENMNMLETSEKIEILSKQIEDRKKNQVEILELKK